MVTVHFSFSEEWLLQAKKKPKCWIFFMAFIGERVKYVTQDGRGLCATPNVVLELCF